MFWFRLFVVILTLPVHFAGLLFAVSRGAWKGGVARGDNFVREWKESGDAKK